MTRNAANDNSRRQRALCGEGDDLPARMSYTEHEREGVHTQKSRLAKRAKIGADWNGEAANDNIAWPLAKALLAEGNTDLLKYALAYRKIYGAAHSNALLGGTTYTVSEGKVTDYVSKLSSDEDIAYGKARKSRSVDAVATTPARRKTPANDATISATSSVPKPWTGDRAVNDMIDAKPKLARLRVVLGAIVEPFEMAVIDGATLAELGNAAGIANRAGAMGAGRALIHMGLLAIRGVLGEVRREDMVA